MKTMKTAVRLGAILLAGACLAPAAASAQAVIRADGSYEYPNAQYKNSTEHYEALKKAANGGVKKTGATLPDWSGIFTRGGGAGLKFDPAQPATEAGLEEQGKLLQRSTRAVHHGSGAEHDHSRSGILRRARRGLQPRFSSAS